MGTYVTSKGTPNEQVYTVKEIVLLNTSQMQARFTKTTLKNIAPSSDDANASIVNNNTVIKNVYIESPIYPVISVAATAPALPDYTTVQSKEWKYYFNTTNNTLYYTKPTTSKAANGDVVVTGMGNWTAKTNFTTATPMQNQTGWLLVDEASNKLYHWHSNTLNQIGGADVPEATSTHTTVNEVTTTSYNLGTVTLSTISEIALRLARSMASEIVTSAQEGTFTDQLYSYDEITNNN